MRTPLIFRHFHTRSSARSPKFESAAWVGTNMPETWSTKEWTEAMNGERGRFIVGWINVSSLNWVNGPPPGRVMESCVTDRLFGGTP